MTYPPSARAVGLTALLALSTAGLPTAAQDEEPLVELVEVPVPRSLPTVQAVAHAGDSRLFLAARDGVVHVLDRGMQEIYLAPDVGGDIRGLAFHPRFAENRYFFLSFVDFLSDDLVVERYEGSADPYRASGKAGRSVLSLPLPNTFSSPRGGHLAFGPDGYLYLSVPDDFGPSADVGECLQTSRINLYGKILRLDVDGPEAGYRVPPDNPFVGEPGARPETWVYGLHRAGGFSFDRATGDLYAVDRGDQVSEVDRQPAGSGGGEHFGWQVREGTRCTGRLAACDAVPECGSPFYVDPIVSCEDCRIESGFVVRDPGLPMLQGDYLFLRDGRLHRASPDGAAGWAVSEIPTGLVHVDRLAEDAFGRILLIDLFDNIHLLIAPGSPAPCFAGPATLCLADGRFRVRATFRTAGDETPRSARVEPLTADTGYLWFFDDDNVELIVKVLDACDPFGHLWVFAGGLTDVAVELRVFDSLSGQERSYRNPEGTPFQPIQDTGAFATCE